MPARVSSRVNVLKKEKKLRNIWKDILPQNTWVHSKFNLAIPYVLEFNKCPSRNRTFSPYVREFWFRNLGSFCVSNEFGKILLVENQNPGVWNPEHSSKNPESKFHRQRLKSSTELWNPQPGIQNPRLPWIPLHEANLCWNTKEYFNPSCPNINKQVSLIVQPWF